MTQRLICDMCGKGRRVYETQVMWAPGIGGMRWKLHRGKCTNEFCQSWYRLSVNYFEELVITASELADISEEYTTSEED